MYSDLVLTSPLKTLFFKRLEKNALIRLIGKLLYGFPFKIIWFVFYCILELVDTHCFLNICVFFVCINDFGAFCGWKTNETRIYSKIYVIK